MNNWRLLLFVSLAINLILAGYLLGKNLLFKQAPGNPETNTKVTTASSQNNSNFFEEINPPAGYEINASYTDLGPKMIKLGVIDLKKFPPLDAQTEKILIQGSTEKIKITRENSHFLLNFFWALGLANKSKILTAGEITKYGGEKDLGNFASTGGWTLSRAGAMNYYSKNSLIKLTAGQEGLVEAVAAQIYRPCCNNSTAFPDCNHGMALLGVLELIAANGASQDEMFSAAKYFNAFWFPGNYYDLASYFKNKEGKSFKDVDPRILLSKDYSSATGWQTAKKWLIDQGIVQEPPKQSGGCGV